MITPQNLIINKHIGHIYIVYIYIHTTFIIYITQTICQFLSNSLASPVYLKKDESQTATVGSQKFCFLGRASPLRLMTLSIFW